MSLQISPTTPLLLGSGSPRRRDILTDLGLPIVVRPGNAPEDLYPGDTLSGFLERVVQAKLKAARDCAIGISHAGILVADTVVVVDDDILGKPQDIEDAFRLLSRIAGRQHQVWTRYAIQGQAGAPSFRSVATSVTLRRASESELRAYAASCEGLDKAGAYAAQGLGAFLIERIEGSYTNVVGLPAMEVVQDLLALGLLGEFPLSLRR